MRLIEVSLVSRELASYSSTLLLRDNYSFRAGDVLILCRLTFTSTQEECKKPEETTSNARTLLNVRPNKEMKQIIAKQYLYVKSCYSRANHKSSF